MTDLSTKHIQCLLAEATPGPWRFSEGIEDTPWGTEEIMHEVYAAERSLFGVCGDSVTDEYPGNLPLAAAAPEVAHEVLRMREELIDWANDEAQAHNALVKQAPEAGGAGIITTHKTIYNRILEILGDHDG